MALVNEFLPSPGAPETGGTAVMMRPGVVGGGAVVTEGDVPVGLGCAAVCVAHEGESQIAVAAGANVEDRAAQVGKDCLTP